MNQRKQINQPVCLKNHRQKEGNRPLKVALAGKHLKDVTHIKNPGQMMIKNNSNQA